MQRVARQNQPLLQFPAPSVLDVFQIAMFGRTVNFVTQDGMSQVRTEPAPGGPGVYSMSVLSGKR